MAHAYPFLFFLLGILCLLAVATTDMHSYSYQSVESHTASIYILCGDLPISIKEREAYSELAQQLTRQWELVRQMVMEQLLQHHPTEIILVRAWRNWKGYKMTYESPLYMRLLRKSGPSSWHHCRRLQKQLHGKPTFPSTSTGCPWVPLAIIAVSDL